MSIIISIDHGYYAIKTAHCSFPAGLTSYGEHEPYTHQGLLEFGGCFFVCGTGRQPIQRDKTINDNYYLLTLAAIQRKKTIKFLCIVDFPLSKQGIFFITLTQHKAPSPKK